MEKLLTPLHTMLLMFYYQLNNIANNRLSPYSSEVEGGFGKRKSLDEKDMAYILIAMPMTTRESMRGAKN
eukprot:scaffold3420_cov239-Alexandrium_tamarense.AAC.3